MASVQKDILIETSPDRVWDAIRDIGAVHTRLAPGMITATQLDGDSRLVTFVNGTVFRERIIGIDDERRRLAYAIVGWQASHYSASFQVFPADRGQSRVLWTADILPDDLAQVVEGFMQQGCSVMKKTIEDANARTGEL